MSVSHKQLVAFLEGYQGQDVTAEIELLLGARSVVHLSNEDWMESDASTGVAEGICYGFGIPVTRTYADEMTYTKVGSYAPATDESEEIIEREFFGQGYIFKDAEAFYLHPDQVCYIAELHDGTYTKQDFVDLVNGREDFAEELFLEVDWQSPETLLEEWMHGEWDMCPKCGWFYSAYDVHEKVPPDDPRCVKCGANLEELIELEGSKHNE